jgi:glycosyltransferase involved in cell wall biosynthesis
MFTVIIPLYNKSTYIEKCLESVLNQTYKKFEVIVVNDGSTDNGLDLVKKVELKVNTPGTHIAGDVKLKVINQQNLGVSAARNRGVKVAKYDYIAFLDADDWWDERFLQEMKGLIETFPTAGMFSSGFFRVKNGKTVKANVGVENEFEKGFIDYFSVYSNTFCTPVNCSFVVVHKKVFEKENGFDTNLKFGEDFDLWVRILLKNKLAYLNKPLAFSNQDVPDTNRALGSGKLYTKESFFIFNLSYLADQEENNASLKKLLDGLRVRSLQHYYLSGIYKGEVNALLEKVDFRLQPLYYRFIYKFPKFLVQLFLTLRLYASRLKQSLLNNTDTYSIKFSK